jgi:hypothetical protein
VRLAASPHGAFIARHRVASDVPLAVVVKPQTFIQSAKFRSSSITVEADQSAPHPLCVSVAPSQHHARQAASSPRSANGDSVHVHCSARDCVRPALGIILSDPRGRHSFRLDTSRI